MYGDNCDIDVKMSTKYSIPVCWLLPSDQSFYRQIAGYVRSVRDPRVGQ